MVEQTLQLMRIRPADTDSPQFEETVRLLHQEIQEIYPPDIVPPLSQIHRNLKTIEDSANFVPEVYLVRTANDSAIGWIRILFPRPGSANFEERKHVAPLYLWLTLKLRRQGIGTEMLRFATNISSERGISRFGGYAETESGIAFAQRVGATVASEESDYRLAPKDIDWQMIQDWYDSGEKNNPQTQIVRFDGLYSDDDTELSRFCELLSSVTNDIPRGETVADPTEITIKHIRAEQEQNVKRGIVATFMVTIEADGRLTSVTKIKYNHESPHHLYQGITGVRRGERGRGLAKWLKAAMLLHIKERYPDTEIIGTTNFQGNAPMVSINNRIGFQMLITRNFYKLMFEDVKAYLKID